MHDLRDGRRAVLDAYAERLLARETALDVRAAAILEAEEALKETERKKEDEKDRLVSLERTMRLEMATFLEDLSGKQAVLAELEVCARLLLVSYSDRKP